MRSLPSRTSGDGVTTHDVQELVTKCSHRRLREFRSRDVIGTGSSHRLEPPLNGLGYQTPPAGIRGRSAEIIAHTFEQRPDRAGRPSLQHAIDANSK